jgi:hypothetical protein
VKKFIGGVFCVAAIVLLFPTVVDALPSKSFDHNINLPVEYQDGTPVQAPDGFNADPYVPSNVVSVPTPTHTVAFVQQQNVMPGAKCITPGGEGTSPIGDILTCKRLGPAIKYTWER